MQAPIVRPGGGLPKTDGDVNLYVNAEAAAQGWFSTNRRVIFVNGMDNSPADHRDSALGLSMLQGCPVIGVFNRSDGLWGDLGQCVADKLRMSPVQSGSETGYEGWALGVEALYLLAKKAYPMLQKTDFVGTMIDGNPATHSLYGLLVGQGGVARSITPIYSHSQGNLITSNALTAVALALGTSALSGVEVNSFGSPCRYWPPKIKRNNNAFTFDPVSWLDLRADMSSSKVGFVAAHGFKTYMAKDAEFVINRFRFGGFGMTTGMDEEGLADFLITLGPNTRRLRPIFERLGTVHVTDSDDVTVAYVERASDATLRAIKHSDPRLIDLMIALLRAGWTASDEQRAITRLQKL